jgi:hypothetical protein
MRVSRLVLSAVALVGMGVNASAHLIHIPTNLGKGADAEVREEDTNAGGFGGVHRGTNRGNSTELAVRARNKVNDTTYTGTNTSIQFMKFDISSLPNSSDTGFWDTHEVWFRGYTRNANNWRAWRPDPNSPTELQSFPYGLKALDPAGTYSTAQTDRNGNAYNASFYAYDWKEGTGNDALTGDPTGITYYNAPGLKPYCATSACATTAVPGNTYGFNDDFDSNVLSLGNVPMPNRLVGNNLPQRVPLTYKEQNLEDLVKQARDAGLDTITLIGYSVPDGSNFLDYHVNFLNGQNQLLAPKEQTTIVAAQPNDNIAGRYSPQLIIAVPEPASVALLGLGLAAALIARRRK